MRNEFRATEASKYNMGKRYVLKLQEVEDGVEILLYDRKCSIPSSPWHVGMFSNGRGKLLLFSGIADDMPGIQLTELGSIQTETE
jgi:hypothetical protein